MVEKNKTNRIHTIKVLDGFKQLTAGTLYKSGQIVLDEKCLNHVK